MAVLENIDRLTVAEKLEAIEELMASLDEDALRSLPAPEWHREVLEERMRRYEAGETKTHTVEEVRAMLLRPKHAG